ncbi:hypothetical protein TSUD_84680 [Trifolium subterraneum]|uniref:Uncharacterized protein n=1 Tax=Trifolium subterraneum TaxID=3900 RepID=A0A2Z6PIG1_TRISU|nr:hypothetical protein TSUD_84680 [Trifolium subterraneum]
MRCLSWICRVFSKSVTAQQIGSGINGLGLNALTLDWSAVAKFLSSPLISPFFAIANAFVGYALIVYHIGDSMSFQTTGEATSRRRATEVEESIKGAKIVEYHSRYSAPGSSSTGTASAAAPASVAVPASAASPNLHLCRADA